MKILRIVSFTFLSMVISSCVNKDKGVPLDLSLDLSATLQQAVDGAILVAVNDFVTESGELRTAVNNFCSTSDIDNLAALQQQWRDLTATWYRLALYNFGPLDDDPIFPVYTFIDSLRLQGTDYTSTVRNEISADIAGSQTLDTAYFAAKTFNRIGLLALEVLIFETASTEHSQVSTDIISDYQANSRKCDVLKGVAEQLESRALSVQSGWSSAYKTNPEPYSELFLNNQLDDGFDSPVQRLIASVQEFLDYLQQRHVATTAAQLSQFSWDAIAASIDEVEFLLSGTGGDEADSFFSKMIEAGRQDYVDLINTNLAATRQAIADQNPDMLEVQLGFLDGNFKREIPNSLDVVLGLNFTDGD